MKDALEARVVYVRDAPTSAEGRRFIMADGATIRFAAREAPFHRKAIVITNRGTATIQVRFARTAMDADGTAALVAGDIIGGYTVVADDVGTIGLTVFATSTVTLAVSDNVWIRNAAGSTQRVDVTEIFYI